MRKKEEKKKERKKDEKERKKERKKEEKRITWRDDLIHSKVDEKNRKVPNAKQVNGLAKTISNKLYSGQVLKNIYFFTFRVSWGMKLVYVKCHLNTLIW